MFSTLSVIEIPPFSGGASPVADMPSPMCPALDGHVPPLLLQVVLLLSPKYENTSLLLNPPTARPFAGT